MANMSNDKSEIQNIEFNNNFWVNILNPKDKEIAFLKEKYNFHPLDLQDAFISKKSQRPQISLRKDYIFLIFIFPVYDDKSREILPAEIDFFITKDTIITLHDNKLTGIEELFNKCLESEYYRDLYMSKNPEFLLSEILDKLFENCFPMLDHIAEDNESIEDNIFKGQEKAMVKEILIIKRNIVDFRTIMQSHRSIIRKIMDTNLPFFSAKNDKTYYEKLLMQSKDIWELLEGHKESIDALHETNESAISFRLNDVMKTLTVISVIFLPLTLVASIFGMNNQFMPLINNISGFWIIIVIMGIMTLSMLLFFKLKKWL